MSGRINRLNEMTSLVGRAKANLEVAREEKLSELKKAFDEKVVTFQDSLKESIQIINELRAENEQLKTSNEELDSTLQE